MDFEFVIESLGLLSFSAEVPEELKGYYIPGSAVFTAATSFGVLMIQEIATTHHKIWYSVMHCTEDCTLHLKNKDPIILLHATLLNKLEWRSKESDVALLNEGQYVFSYTTHLDGSFTFHAKNTYVSFDMSLAMDSLSALRQRFHLLDPFLQSIRKKKSAVLYPGLSHITKRMNDAINDIVKDNYKDTTLLLYADTSLQMLLVLSLHEVYNNRYGYSAASKEIGYTVKTIIEKDLTHVPDINRITMDLGISLSKLQKDFKLDFDIGPVEYWRQRRMKRSAQLLIETDTPIKDIAYQLGFAGSNSFSRAFHQTFGWAPDEWRRRML